MRMVPEVYDLLISSSPYDTSLVAATIVALSSRGFDAWSAVTEKRTKRAAGRLQNAVDSTKGFLFVITPQTQFSNQMYFELGVAMTRAMSDDPARIIFVLVDTAVSESIPRFAQKSL